MSGGPLRAEDARATHDLELHAQHARRRGRIGLVVAAVCFALLLWGRYHVLRIDAELEEGGAPRTAGELYRNAAVYFVALALGLLGALGGVLVSALSWMYVRHLHQQRAKLGGASGS